jgi:hypothetical protein
MTGGYAPLALQKNDLLYMECGAPTPPLTNAPTRRQTSGWHPLLQNAIEYFANSIEGL